ncbi:MAG: ABC transporter substrate-binding protein [Pseudomonadota bacterium]|nr:ABC transporter substrate-binding protein [Pseudomonadota bacterium]
MTRPIHLLLIAAFILWSLPVASAPQYINAEPLSKILADTAVADIKKGARLQLPVNSRCGDIVTVLANGAQSHTKPGTLFHTAKLDYQLVLQNNFPTQLKSYLSGKTPYLRGTIGMINMAAGALSQDARTKPVTIYQMSWSAGADALVVKPGINSIRSLRGKTIALQAYGPHVDFMSKILQDAGLTVDDVSLRWLPDLTGTANSPVAAFQQDDVDAAFVIRRDALALTSAAAVNADDSIGGTRLLLSTRTANHLIADVYAVRSDYLQSHRKEVRQFVQALMKATEALQTLVADKQSQHSDYQQLISAAALLLLEDETATAEIEGISADCDPAGWQGNVNFFASPTFPRSLAHLSNQMQPALISMGLIESQIPLQHADWDYSQLHDGLSLIGSTSAPRFNQQQVALSVAQKLRKGTRDEGELFSFEIPFEPNQESFPEDLYQDAFRKAVEYASTYGGSLITIEGHSDPLKYLRKKSSGESPLLLGGIKQSAKNHSLSHAVAVRNNVISYALSHGVTLDQSQFAVSGQGIAKPKSGICDSEPCIPVTEQEWRDNMRIEFRILQPETEASLSTPL